MRNTADCGDQGEADSQLPVTGERRREHGPTSPTSDIPVTMDISELEAGVLTIRLPRVVGQPPRGRTGAPPSSSLADRRDRRSSHTPEAERDQERKEFKIPPLLECLVGSLAVVVGFTVPFPGWPVAVIAGFLLMSYAISRENDVR